MNSITWYGHSAFMITWNNTRILIDPFLSGNPVFSGSWEDLPSPDVVLVTHHHGDHVGDAFEICKKSGAQLGTIVVIAAEFTQKGLPASQILNGIGFNIGGTMEVNGIGITMTEAFHSSDGIGMPTGFIITLTDGRSIYHAGDTGIFSNMETWGKLYDIHYALLPAGGVFTMDYRQAALAAGMLRAKNLIPMHWGTFPILAQNMDLLRDQLTSVAPQCTLMVVEKGKAVSI